MAGGPVRGRLKQWARAVWDWPDNRIGTSARLFVMCFLGAIWLALGEVSIEATLVGVGVACVALLWWNRWEAALAAGFASGAAAITGALLVLTVEDLSRREAPINDSARLLMIAFTLTGTAVLMARWRDSRERIETRQELLKRLEKLDQQVRALEAGKAAGAPETRTPVQRRRLSWSVEW